MYELDTAKAVKKTVKGHQYYVFPKPHTHSNQVNRPKKYTDKGNLTPYKGAGLNPQKDVSLHPDVGNDVNCFMTALLDYGQQINDWSMSQAYILVGFYPDDDDLGRRYLNIIKQTIKADPKLAGLTFPDNLEKAAVGVLGPQGDDRRSKFHADLASSPGWNAALVKELFDYVDNSLAPRGANPHATGLVFDLNFTIALKNGGETKVDAARMYNEEALKSAAGVWINQYSMQFHFDSYNTDKEIWHMEWRKPKS